MRALTTSILLALLAGCDPPPVHATADPRLSELDSRVEGTVVVQSQARGNVVVFLFDRDHPPPPSGTGHPVSFSFVARSTLFGTDTSGGGPFTAPYAFSQVPAGNYFIHALLDHDECPAAGAGCRTPDFNPYFRVTQEPNQGDVGGAAADAVTQTLTPISISKDARGALNFASDVTVSISDALTIPTDRPAFHMEGVTTFKPAGGPLVIKLVADAIHQAHVDERHANAFLVRYVDANGDGVPDDTDGDGVGDLWPKVFVRKLADNPPTLNDENDANNDGVVDATGIDYLHADGTKDGHPDAVVLGARIVPTAIIPLLTDALGKPKLGPVPVAELDVALLPAALDISGGVASPQRLQSVPPGRYAITLVSFTGQTWRVPNELAPGIAEGLDFEAVNSQSVVITVP